MEESNQQSQSPLPANPTPPVVNSGNSKLIPIILGVAAAIVIAIGAYALGTKQTQPPFQSQKECEDKTGKKCSLEMCQESEGSSQPPGCKSGFYSYEDSSPIATQPSPTPIDETASWKTYTNTKYNYQFKYPDKDWVFDWLVPPEPNEDIGTFDSISFLKTTTVPNKYVNQSVWWMRFFVSVQPNPNQLTPKEIYYFGQYNKDIPAGLSTSVPFENQYLKDLRNKVSRETKYPQGVENTTLLGYASLRETYNNWGSLTLVKDSLTFVMSWNIEDGKETAENAQQTFNQILSTFRFSDENLDGKVWVDIDQIGAAINIYYLDNKKLPQNLEVLTMHPRLNYFKLNNNPYTGKPYQLTTKSDGSGFILSGTVRDGTEYKKEFLIK